MEKYLSVKEIMENTGLGRSTVYAMFQIPGFPVTRVGKRILVSERALTEWFNKGGTSAKDCSVAG